MKAMQAWSVVALVLSSVSARAADFNLQIRVEGGTGGAVTINPGCRLTYALVGSLNEASGATDGVALFSADLTLSGPSGLVALPRMLRPIPGTTMSRFDIPSGITNPPVDASYVSGFGGTVGAAGTPDANVLLQVGGMQNTIKSDGTIGASPIGAVLGGVCQTAQTLAVGTVTMPMTPGTYTLHAQNVVVNAIRDHELDTPAAEFFRTEPVFDITVQDLTINVQSTSTVTIASANPPLAVDNPHIPGAPFRDPLQTGTSTTQITQGIGAPGTPVEGTVQYAPIQVTFCGGAPTPVPAPGNITVICTNQFASPPPPLTDQPCPTVTGVTGAGSGPYNITLSGPIPTRECTTITFAGTLAGQRLQYQSLPGDVSLDGASNTQDLLALIAALNSGTANNPNNISRYDVNRSSTGATPVNTQDWQRIIQLLQGTQTTEVWSGKTVQPCP